MVTVKKYYDNPERFEKIIRECCDGKYRQWQACKMLNISASTFIKLVGEMNITKRKYRNLPYKGKYTDDEYFLELCNKWKQHELTTDELCELTGYSVNTVRSKMLKFKIRKLKLCETDMFEKLCDEVESKKIKTDEAALRLRISRKAFREHYHNYKKLIKTN